MGCLWFHEHPFFVWGKLAAYWRLRRLGDGEMEGAESCELTVVS